MEMVDGWPWASAFVFVAGLAVLLFSARYFVSAIASVASALGVSPLVIGMTVVAFGTSTPELVVNSVAAWRGETALAFGNIIGSCIVNVGFVLGVTALIRPLDVETTLITREIPMLWVAASALLILALDRPINRAGADLLSRSDGLILLLLFAIFLYYTAIYSAACRAIEGVRGVEDKGEQFENRPAGRQLVIAALGLVGVSVGADWTVEGAVDLARAFRMPENVIGLTVVSIGTTLPELATCVIAARAGNSSIALGNVVGSNIFNLLAIGGLAAVLSPVAVPPGGQLDLAVMAVLSMLLLPLAIRSGRTITRGEGALLMSVYVGYLVYRIFA